MGGFLLFTTLLLSLYGSSRSDLVCQTGPIDLVFVIDESGSVLPSDYKLSLAAAQRLTQSLDVGQTNKTSRVGLVLFDDQATVEFNLNAYSANAQVIDAIGRAGYTGGETDIAKGMDVAIKQVFKPNKRAAPRVMIIITDGQDSSDVVAERSQASEMKIRTYAIGVGSLIDVAELTKATGDVNRVYNITSYAELAGVMDLICEEIAASVAPPLPTDTPTAHSPRTCGCDSEDDYVNVWLDIAFVLDSSDAVAKDDFDNMKTLLYQIGSYYTIGKGKEIPNKFTRVAIVNTNNEALRFANFSTYKDGNQMAADVSANLNKLGGKFDAEKGVKAVQNMFDEEENAGNRLNVRRVMVVFSTETIDCREENEFLKRRKFAAKAENKELCRLVAQMQDENVAIISVAMKLPEETSFPYIDIAPECDRLTGGEQMVPNLMRRLCLANCYCLSPYTQFEVGNTCEKYGECLFVHNMALSYSGAKKTCAKENDTLSDALSVDKDLFIKDLHLMAGFFPYWIGGKTNKRQITWDSGVTGEGNDYTYWGPGQPDGTNQCVFMKQYESFKTAWYSDKCGMMTPTHFFSCQKDACSANRYCEYTMKGKIH